MQETPKVIIHCLVYNHELYLRDCLNGFVMQKTNFSFRAVVHDDCSTDGSVAIIREYAEKYPDIIEPIYETENQWMKGMLNQVMDSATLGRSPYIAYCEGDDYWTDPYKLQKQVDFLDENPEYSMCFTACEIINDYHLGVPLQSDNIQDREYTSTELYENWIVPTASICLKEGVLHDIRRLNSYGKILNGDIIRVLTASHNGKVRGMSQAMTKYRVHPGGVTYDESRYIGRLRLYPRHYKYILDNYPLVDKRVAVGKYLDSCLKIIQNHSFTRKEKLHALFNMYKVAPIYAFALSIRMLVGKVKNMVK